MTLVHLAMDDQNSLPLSLRAEALLFAAGEPLTLKKLSQSLGVTSEELSMALDELHLRLSGRSIRLVRTTTEVGLAVADIVQNTVKAANEKELGRDIGDAGLEVLAILLYKGSSTRADIDYIRGVNTSSTVRNLLARGLIERSGNPEDGREYIYRPTVDLLAHLGVTEARELPEYANIANELAAFAHSRGPFGDNGISSDNLHDGQRLREG